MRNQHSLSDVRQPLPQRDEPVGRPDVEPVQQAVIDPAVLSGVDRAAHVQGALDGARDAAAEAGLESGAVEHRCDGRREQLALEREQGEVERQLGARSGQAFLLQTVTVAVHQSRHAQQPCSRPRRPYARRVRPDGGQQPTAHRDQCIVENPVREDRPDVAEDVVGRRGVQWPMAQPWFEQFGSS